MNFRCAACSLFEEQNLPDGKSNKGRVQAFDGPIHIADAAMVRAW